SLLKESLWPLQWRLLDPGQTKQSILLIDWGGRLLHEACQEPRSRSFLVERISLSIQRENSASVLGSLLSSSSFEEIVFTYLSTVWVK
ncbi:hypothetical protein WDU94_000256, partial [Cyamophila willieti]